MIFSLSAAVLQVLNVFDHDVNRSVIHALKGNKSKNDKANGLSGWSKDVNNLGAYVQASTMNGCCSRKLEELINAVDVPEDRARQGRQDPRHRPHQEHGMHSAARAADISKTYERNVIKENSTHAVGLIVYRQKAAINEIYKNLAGENANKMSSSHPVPKALGRETSDKFLAELATCEFGERLRPLMVAEFTKRGKPEEAFVDVRCACEKVHAVIKCALEKKHGVNSVEDELADGSLAASASASASAPASVTPTSAR